MYMISVTLVCNSGQGVPRTVQIREGTTVEEFLQVNFDGNLDDFTVSLRRDGSSEVADLYDVLEDSDRLSVSPTKVEGATL
jgi:hypothetical protein